MQMDAHDINTYEEMTRTISQTDIVKEAYHLLELEEVVPGRANLAGVHLDEQPNNTITYHIEMADPVPPPKSSRRSVSKRYIPSLMFSERRNKLHFSSSQNIHFC
jgi:hypothetical protein